MSQILAGRDDADVWVLVRRESLERFERLAAEGERPSGDRAKPLVGELTTPDLGLSDDADAGLGEVDHIVHCAAIHDITVAEADQRAANVDGTRAIIDLALRLDAILHHVSSIAVAGTYRGEFIEDDFDVAQDLPSPYHQTKFDAELLVRSALGLRYRIYRPAVVVGDSRTGEMDKVDGPYYFFGVLAKLARLPRFTPMALPDTGRTNIVSVDFVAEAVVQLIHSENGASWDGRTFHLTAAKSIGLHGIYRGVAKAAGLPPLRGGAAAQHRNTDHAGHRAREDLAQHGGHATRRPRRNPRHRRPVRNLHLPQHRGSAAWHRDSGAGVRIVCTEIIAVLGRAPGPRSGAPRRSIGAAGGQARDHHRRLQRDRTCVGDRRRRTRSDRVRVGAHRRSARRTVAEIRDAGGQAHAFICDVTDSTSVEHTIKDILGRFGHVDYLVNNAGRSIRRASIPHWAPLPTSATT
jgi:thioester reductase-like protein